MTAFRTAVLIALVALAGCKSPESKAAAPKEDQLVVFAAASLRDVFTAMGDDFQRAHPGIKLTFNFAGTQELRTQVDHGAAVDVFASADQKHMKALLEGGKVVSPATFARNEPVIVVAKESAASVHGLADLPHLSRIVIGTPEVPIGRYTLQILDRASPTLGADFRTKVEAKVVSRELNVRQVLAKVTLGEADAGFVYRTDAQSAKEAPAIVTIPAEINVIAEYPIAPVVDASHPTLARAWIDYVLSSAGQKTLHGAGFLPPSASRSAP